MWYFDGSWLWAFETDEGLEDESEDESEFLCEDNGFKISTEESTCFRLTTKIATTWLVTNLEFMPFLQAPLKDQNKFKGEETNPAQPFLG